MIRDIVQNHLRLLTLIAMEPPVAYEAGAIRDRRQSAAGGSSHRGAQVAAQTVRGQYTAGTINGSGCRATPSLRASRGTRHGDIRSDQWYVDNWRWQGVPFYPLRKRLPTRVTEVSIHFEPPHLLFGQGRTDTCTRTCWRCASSRMKASRCAQSQSCRDRA